MNFKKSILFGMATMLMVSCGTAKKSDKNQVVSRMEPNEMLDPSFGVMSDAHRDMVNRNNAFALKLFNEVSDMDSKVISPISVTYLMSMLANGADGDTRQEILATLGWNVTFGGNVTNKNGEQAYSKRAISVDDINELCKGIIDMSSRLDLSTTMSIANYIAVNKNNKLKENFKKSVSSNYMAEVESLDFTSGKTADHINSWCSKHTDGMIPKIIDNVEASAVSYIMNAIYFNGSWPEKFDKSETKLDRFQGYTRDIKKVNMMHQNKKLDYVSNEVFSALNLPYGNGAYSMTVLLPNADKSISDMMNVLDAEKLEKLRYDMDECIVDVKLPRFTTTLELPLNDIISKLGAPSIFNAGKANFSNFADGDVFVSKMLQKAKIEVSEEGTKAAAVTAAIMTMSALNTTEPRRVDFHANRPFVYVITERSTGAIFFIGQFTGNE